MVLTSDHGEEFLEHGGLTHGSALYDEALRVPLIVAGPGVSKGHRVLPSAAVDGPSATEREVLRALGYQ